MTSKFNHALAASMSQGLLGAASGFLTDGFLTMPAGVPEPIVWFSPRFVELDGNGKVTKLINKGRLGAAHDATPETANLLTIENSNGGWDYEKVFRLPATTTKGYTFGDVPLARTAIGITTYDDGAASLTNYGALWSGSSEDAGNELQLGTGNSGALMQPGAGHVFFKNGVPKLSSDAFAPLTKDTVASTNTSTFSGVGKLFRDNFSTTRVWKGQVGDILFFEELLSDAQIAALHTMLTDFYGVGEGVDPIASLPTALANGGAETADMTGWITSGTPATATSATGLATILPRSGANFFVAGDAATAFMEQPLRFVDADLAAIDAGEKTATFYWFDAAFEGDSVRAELEFYDAFNTLIGSPVVGAESSPDAWTVNFITSAVPAGARKYVIRFVFTRVDGVELNAYVDSISVSVITPAVLANTILMPAGVPDPAIWFSADSVTLDGSSKVTTIHNKGTAGASKDATPATTNLASVGTAGARSIFTIPVTSSGGYSFASTTVKSMMGLATYKTGVETAFTDFDGFMSGTFEFVGASGSGNWTANLPKHPFKNGVEGASGMAVLPLNLDTIGATPLADETGTATRIWQDDAGTSRNWVGQAGDMMWWTQNLTAAQMALLHQAYATYYGL